MKILSVFGPVPQVLKRLQLFLAENRFKNVNTDYSLNEITAERRTLFVVHDSILLKVRHSKENVTNIEMKVNPWRDHPTQKDEIKETSFQSRIYLYF